MTSSDHAEPGLVLVTGASGFIGTRLCAMWHSTGTPRFRALCRNPKTAAALRRTGYDAVSGDLLAPPTIAAALQGCTAVVHLAHGDDAASIAATNNLLTAAAQAGIARFIHISSMSVHGPAPTEADTDESTATIGHYGEPYSDSKAAQELAVQAAMQQGLRGMILRPTVVYGPGSPFVRDVINDAELGRVTLVDGGSGRCNAVFVDDVCDAIDRALQMHAVNGEAVFINGDDTLTWGEFIRVFSAGVTPAPATAHIESSARLEDVAGPPRRGVMTIPRRIVAKVLRTVGVHPRPRLTPMTPGRLARESVRVTFSNARAKALLGWSPQHDFNAGSRVTQAWLRATRPNRGEGRT